MSHLSPEELLDVVEGARPEASIPHLASCAACRQQLADVRSAVASIKGTAGDDVPEPSPLFWEHFSARVREVVAEEPRAQRAFGLDRQTARAWRWLVFTNWGRGAAFASVAAAALVLAVLMSRPSGTPAPTATTASTASASSGEGQTEAANDSSPDALAAIVSDPAFGVISDLAGGIDVDTALEAGLASEGSAEHAVIHMTGGELAELERLLNAQLAGKQAS